MAALRRDVSYALRGLGQRPGFTLTVLLTFALGIGGTAAMFSVVYHVLLRPLPYQAPGDLVMLEARSPQGEMISLSIPNYEDWSRRNRSFDSFGAAAGWNLTLTGRGPARVLEGELVLGDFFATLGVPAAAGRTLAGAETGPGAETVAVVGHRFWADELGGDPATIGSTLTLDGRPFQVVGVMPPGFGFPSPETAVYLPMGVYAESLPWDDRDSSFGTRAVARLAPGVALDAARADLGRVALEVREVAGKEVATPELEALEDRFLGDVGTRLWVLLAATGGVLLIAVANIVNLLLIRGERRGREIAVRTALGASRGALVRQLMMESLLLGLGGGVLGLGLSAVAVEALPAVLPAALPATLVERITIDAPVAAFTAAVALFAGFAAGLAPALRATRAGGQRSAAALRAAAAGAGGGRSRMRSALVVLEVALALVLLVGSGLMLTSLRRLAEVDKGFDSDGLLTARLHLPGESYPDKADWLAFHRQLLERTGALPGVERAAVSLLLPLTGRSWEFLAQPEGVPYDPDGGDSVLYSIVSDDYFETLGVPLLRGRGFTTGDRDGATPVAIIDETMAARYWPGEDPIGKRLTFEETEGAGDGETVPVYRTVVGVAANVRHYELASPSRIQAYVPLEQSLARWGMSLYVTLRTAVPPSRLASPLRAAVTELDPDAPLSRVQPLSAYVDDELSASRSLGGLLTAFATGALLLAALGIFGVVSFTVTQRSREIGIRMALGAESGRVVRWVVGRGLVLVGGGLAVGLAASVAFTRLLASLVFEVSPLEPAVLGGVSVLLAAVSAVATLLPAQRAARVDPVRVLVEG